MFATDTAHQVVRAGHTLAWNPSITRVKSEDTVMVHANAHEVLTSTGTWPWAAVEVQVTGTGGQAGFSHTIERPAMLVR